MDERLVRFQSRVMRHRKSEGDEFAIHEVYLNAQDQVVTYTLDALSPRVRSVEQLRMTIEGLILRNDEGIETGDQNFFYSRGDMEEWLRCLDKAVLDFDEEGE
jgi:hypothetical protein